MYHPAMSNYFTMYKIVPVLAFPAITATIIIVYFTSVHHSSIMVAEQGRVTENGRIQIFQLI